MSVFGVYSRYYNLLYRDKDYAGESDYVHRLIRKYSANAKTILDLGCGTGRHDQLLAEKGYQVTGVDISEEMLAVARSKPGPVTFHHGDVRNVRLGATFDVVISLFHVMSYQVSNDDLSLAFATARAHLNPGGIFIFDCWYGPAVLSDPPVVRVKRLEDDEIEVVRIAEPVMHPNENVVNVNYQVTVRQKAGGGSENLLETHRMRYLFQPELELFLKNAALSMVTASEWMTGNSPGSATWGVCFVAKR